MTPAGQLAAAIDLLGEIEVDPRPADAVANGFFRARRFIGGSDRREIGQRVWNVLRSYRRLAWWLDAVHGEVNPRLLVAALAVLNGATPERLAADFSGRYGPPPLDAAEMAVVSRLSGHTLEHPRMPDAVRYEVPDWILPLLNARFASQLGPQLRALMQPAPLDLRVNLLQISREDALAALTAEGFHAIPTPFSPFGLRLANRQPVTASKIFQSGAVEIQDEGSQLVALLTDARPGMRVADYCAGAGGKTLALAMTMRNKGHIAACDVSVPRLDGAVRRLRRAGVHNAERHLLEVGDKWLKRQEKNFDRVLVDAPCTGTGTWRRNPDARLRLRAGDLAEILPKQAMILDQAARLVKPGGRLIYATCSLLIEENEIQVEGFLASHAEFVQVGAADPLPEALHGQALRLTPLEHQTDGFFAAVLERSV